MFKQLFLILFYAGLLQAYPGGKGGGGGGKGGGGKGKGLYSRPIRHSGISPMEEKDYRSYYNLQNPEPSGSHDSVYQSYGVRSYQGPYGLDFQPSKYYQLYPAGISIHGNYLSHDDGYEAPLVLQHSPGWLRAYDPSKAAVSKGSSLQEYPACKDMTPLFIRHPFNSAVHYDGQEEKKPARIR